MTRASWFTDSNYSGTFRIPFGQPERIPYNYWQKASKCHREHAKQRENGKDNVALVASHWLPSHVKQVIDPNPRLIRFKTDIWIPARNKSKRFLRLFQLAISYDRCYGRP